MIDLIAQDPATDELVLGMVELRPWDDSDRQLFELQEKVNAYLSFALDGELQRNFPQFATKRLHLRLDCIEAPTQRVDYFIGLIRDQIAFQEILLSVNVVPDLAERMAEIPTASSGGGCGSGCGCASEEPAAADSGCCGGESSNGSGCGCH